ncbi:hypothetical protein TWF191_000496 [Orbilia oligospora]|uniref:Uncharacterized protein n=1 Tax=Orbilia oligospora TaxID=2813651 RepID=A0A7C8UI85_ORBOL|nr:hypothetical protein TWF191_000496 [Orbilia oligospora]
MKNYGQAGITQRAVASVQRWERKTGGLVWSLFHKIRAGPVYRVLKQAGSWGNFVFVDGAAERNGSFREASAGSKEEEEERDGSDAR